MLPTALPNCVAIDFETTGLNVWRGARIFSGAATFANGETGFWRGEFSGLKRILGDPTIDKVFHNMKFDLRMAKYSGFKVRGRCWDNMIFYHLIDGRMAEGGLGLEMLAMRFLPSDQRKVVEEITRWFDDNRVGKEHRWNSFAKLPPPLLQKRNVGDTQITMSLFKRAYTTVVKLFPFLVEQEHKLLYTVDKMEDRGILIDYEEIERQKDRFDAIIDNVLSFCEGVVGRDHFNLNSRADQEELLAKAGVLEQLTERTDGTKRFPNGQLKLQDYNLRNLHHPVPHMLLLGKAASKMRNTFLEQMEREAVNGVLHPNLNQLGTTTGRFSCSKPNLTNIPIEGDRRTAYTADEAAEALDCTWIEYAPHLKRIFKVREGKAHIHSDKKQAEMAYIAHYTNDPVLIKIFDSGQNFHEGVCRTLYGELTKGLKTRTKAVVFGFCYGAGNPQLAKKIGSTLGEAIATRKRLEKALPALPRWKRELETQIRERGYLQTIHGRRHYLRTSESYISVNRMCQGSVADEVKSRMVALDEYFQSEGVDGQVLLMIHDDICSEVPADQTAKLVPEVHRIMHELSMPHKLQLPSSLDVTYTRWSDLEEVKDLDNVPTREDSIRRYRSEHRKAGSEHLLVEPKAG